MRNGLVHSLRRIPNVTIANACGGEVMLDDADGLLLTGGADISPEFLRQPVPDPIRFGKRF